MKPETKYLHKSEACYETEYALRQDIHFRIGEIIKLEYINAKQGSEIERLNSKIENLERELAIRDIPRMKESLKAGALLDQADKLKIGLADSILEEFGIETMVMYERLITDGDIDIKIVDRRNEIIPKW